MENRRPSEELLWTTTAPGVPLFMNNTLTIAADRLEEYLEALHEVLVGARAEASCLYLNVGQDVDDPCTVVLSEGWTDLVEYRDVVLRKDYFRRYLEMSEGAYAKPRQVTVLTPVSGTA